MNKYAIAIHGGAGTIIRSQMSPDLEKAYKAGLLSALKAGEAVLAGGGSALDAVQASITILEDDILFNAGKGSVFTHDGKHEMDACLMNGKDLKAGAVAGVSNVKNPIILARAVMQHSEHVLLVKDGAEEFAKRMDIAFEPDYYFFSAQRYDQLQKIRDTNITQLDHTTAPDNKKFGTVGAVALDIMGDIAAGTSTGGMTNKRYGRVGDTPIVGAGTYANNKTCAISCTGHGEYFIRAVVAHDISCLMEYKGLTLQQACDEVVYKKLVDMGGEGGLIAIDAAGDIQMPFNSEGMYRGMKKSGEDGYTVEIYKD